MDPELIRAIQARRPTKKHEDSSSSEEAEDGDSDSDGDEGEGEEQPQEESETEGSPKEGSRIRSSAFRRLKQQWATVEEEIGGVPLPSEWKRDQDDEEEGESGSSSRGAQPEPEPDSEE